MPVPSGFPVAATTVDAVDPIDERPKVHEIGKRSYRVADVEPLDVDGVRTVEIGTALWLVAFLMLLPFYSKLEETGRIWWLWACMAGFGLGLIGVELCRTQRKRRLASRAS